MHIHRKGPTDPIVLPVALTSSVPTSDIDVGTLVGVDADGALYPATGQTWDTDLATTQTAFAAAFAGVAESRSRAGTDDDRDLNISVNTDGLFEMELASSATLKAGEYVGPAKATGNALVNKVVKVTTKAKAIAVVQETMAAAGTKVLCRLINTQHKR